MSIVLNASPGCCCCGPSPIQPGCFRQRVPGSAGEESVHYNTWAPAVPAVLAGRVDPAAWLNFINAISVLGESQPSCLVQCFTCSCAQAAADFAASLVQIEAAYMQPLGAVAMSLLEYSYETWDNGSEDTPGHWTWATLKYLRVDFPLCRPATRLWRATRRRRRGTTRPASSRSTRRSTRNSRRPAGLLPARPAAAVPAAGAAAVRAAAAYATVLISPASPRFVARRGGARRRGTAAQRLGHPARRDAG